MIILKFTINPDQLLSIYIQFLTMQMEPLKIIVSGSSGFIGSALVRFLTREGHVVKRLIRQKPASGEEAVFWNPGKGIIGQDELEGFHVVIHLAGENLARGKWTRAKKERIRKSRVESVTLAS